MLCSFAQHSEQPQKENNMDVRNSIVLFSIEDKDDEKTFSLERSVEFDHYLKIFDEDDKEIKSIKKLDSKMANKLEVDFASHFLKIQYEMALVDGKCELVFKLNLKSDKIDICEKDEKKVETITPFLKSLKQQFR